MFAVPDDVAAEEGGLLRVLFLWLGSLSPDPGGALVLRHQFLRL